MVACRKNETWKRSAIPHSRIVEYIANGHLAFGGSGTTKLELLSIVTPVIIIPQNQLEQRFAADIENKKGINLHRI
jgi:hypothetical protein